MTGRRLLIAAGVWAMLVGVLWLADSRPSVFVLGGIVAATCAVAFVMRDLIGAVAGVQWVRLTPPARATGDGDARVESIRRQTHGAWWTGSTEIAETLVDLVDERLRVHHQIDRTTDPAGAARVLTPALRRLVGSARRSTATTRELQRIVTDIEAL